MHIASWGKQICLQHSSWPGHVPCIFPDLPLCAIFCVCNRQKQARSSLFLLSPAFPMHFLGISTGWSTVHGNLVILLWCLLILGRKIAGVWLIMLSLILQSQVVITIMFFVTCIFWKEVESGFIITLYYSYYYFIYYWHLPSFLQPPCCFFFFLIHNISVLFPFLLLLHFSSSLLPITAGSWHFWKCQ